MKDKLSNKRASKFLLLSSVVLGSLILSGCDTMPPPVNDYNCYAHIMPIDRDYHSYASKCASEHKGKSNEHYNELAIARLKACYYEKDTDKCQALTTKLEALIATWKEEPGALIQYGYQAPDLQKPQPSRAPQD